MLQIDVGFFKIHGLASDFGSHELVLGQSLIGLGSFDVPSGVDIDLECPVFDSITVQVCQFAGGFLYLGKPVALHPKTSISNVFAIFGDPFWVDSDGETLLFYEYDLGKVEIQFEFLENNELSVVSMMKPGLLSQLDQRIAYGVSKPWPPEEE